MSVVGVIHHLYQFAYISLFLTMVDVMTFFFRSDLWRLGLQSGIAIIILTF